MKTQMSKRSLIVSRPVPLLTAFHRCQNGICVAFGESGRPLEGAAYLCGAFEDAVLGEQQHERGDVRA